MAGSPAVAAQTFVYRPKGGRRVRSGCGLAVGVVLSGCCRVPLGSLGFVSRDSEPVGTKLLRPGTVARSCQTSILGVPIGPRLSMENALAQILAVDAEGNAITNVRMTWHGVHTVLYDRDCLEVRGDLVRTISTVTLPHHAGHEHEAH